MIDVLLVDQGLAVMDEYHCGYEPVPKPRLAGFQDVNDIVGVDEKFAARQSYLPGADQRQADKAADKRRGVDVHRPFALVLCIVDVKTMSSLERRGDEVPQVPEWVAAGAIHFADSPVRQVYRGAHCAYIRRNIQGVEGRNDIAFRVGIVIVADQPVSLGQLLGSIAKTAVKTAGTALVCFAVDHHELIPVESIQPRGSAVGAAVVDHDDAVEIVFERILQGGLQLLEAVIGHDNSDEFAIHLVHYIGVTKKAGMGREDLCSAMNCSAAPRASPTVTSISR